MRINPKAEKWFKTYGVWIIGVVVLLKLMGVDFITNLGTQSIFGSGTGIIFSMSVVIFLIGLFLVVLPEPTTSIVGAVMVVVSLIAGGATILNFIVDIFGSYTNPVLIGLGIFILVMGLGSVFGRRRR